MGIVAIDLAPVKISLEKIHNLLKNGLLGSTLLDLSIIIVNWNVRDLLDRCLASVYAIKPELSVEVIVVDNASQDNSVAMVQEKYPRTILIANTENAGFCRGNNQGIAVSRGEIVALLNPDTEVRSGAMESMVSVLRTNPNAGIVGPTLLTSEGRPEPNGTRFPTTAYELGKAFRLERFLGIEYDFTGYDDPERPKTVWNVDVVCGACMVIRRAVLDEIGGLDEQLFMFYEETDFCLRAHRAGWNTVYLPAAHVYHHWMGSVRQDEIRAARRFFRSR